MRFAAFLTGLVGALVAVANVQAADDEGEGPTIPAFSLYYLMVSNGLKHGESCLDQLASNLKANIIIDFWWGYIRKDCDSYLFQNIDKLMERAQVAGVTGPSDKIKSEILELKTQCAMAVIFDNWERINGSIAKNPEKECVGKKN